MTTTQNNNKNNNQSRQFSGIGKQKTCAQGGNLTTDSLLYSVITYQGTSLQKTQTSVYPNGQIAYNPSNLRRIDIVKELMDTWFTLSRTLIATANISNLKPEFTMQLTAMIERTVSEKATIKSKLETKAIIQEPIQRSYPLAVNTSVEDLNESFHSVFEPASPLAAFQLPKIRTSNKTKDAAIILTPEQQKEMAQIDIQMKKLALQNKEIKLKTQEKKEQLLLEKLEFEIKSLKNKAHRDEQEAKKVYVEAAAQLAQHEIAITKQINAIAEDEKAQTRMTKRHIDIYDQEEGRWKKEQVEEEERVEPTATEHDIKLKERLIGYAEAIAQDTTTTPFKPQQTAVQKRYKGVGPKLTDQQIKTLASIDEQSAKFEQTLEKYGWTYQAFDEYYKISIDTRGRKTQVLIEQVKSIPKINALTN